MLTGLCFCGCSSIADPPGYFLRNIGKVTYVDKLPAWHLGRTNWDGSIEILNTTPLFVTKREILIHEQAHSFEILASLNRPQVHKRFREAFDKTYKSKYIEIEGCCEWFRYEKRSLYGERRGEDV